MLPALFVVLDLAHLMYIFKFRFSLYRTESVPQTELRLNLRVHYAEGREGVSCYRSGRWDIVVGRQPLLNNWLYISRAGNFPAEFWGAVAYYSLIVQKGIDTAVTAPSTVPPLSPL